ncbi:MAG: hypothetical protein IPM53_32245 [Anaerolineaceae bacterium]|nr:hypothetical protein [Anaerolineaceae bacterium]
MDISVSRLNGRLASKLPPELPLGLVFVVGTVSRLHKDGFVLAEESHYLNCHTKEDAQLHVGDEVRASGHLMFDSERLQYYLLARDIEVMKTDPLGALTDNSREILAGGQELLTALTAVKARAAAAPEASGKELPVWVRKLAPPEVQDEAAVEGEEPVLNATGRSAVLDEQLVTMLSQAMDSEEELEVTPELLAPYVPATPVPSAVDRSEGAMGEDSALAVANLQTSYRPANREDTDWLVILLIISFFVLTIAAIVTIILLLI